MDFVILKVNGLDLSNSTHAEAVEAFRLAPEPILVEVVRRKPPPPPSSTSTNHQEVKPALLVQQSQIQESLSKRPPSDDCLFMPVAMAPAFTGHPAGFRQPGARQPMVLCNNPEAVLTDLECGLLDLVEEEEEEDERLDMDYEEITLHRGPEERLGLTLRYSPCDDGHQIMDVYVSEIETGSIAARDGRIRESDQILQINGQDVESRDQAVQLFRSSGRSVTLLLARPHYPIPMLGLGQHSSSLLDNLHMELLTSHPNGACPDLYNIDALDATSFLERHEKDSGVGRATDDSTRTEESSEQEAEGDQSLNRGSQDSFTNSEDITSVGHQSALDTEIAQLNHAMESLALECQELARIKLYKEALLLEEQHQLGEDRQLQGIIKPLPVRPDMSLQPRPVGPDMSLQQRPLGPDMSLQQRPLGPDMSLQPRPVGPDMSLQQRPLGPDMSLQQRPVGPDMSMQQRPVGPDMSLQQRPLGPDMSLQQRPVGPDMSLQQRPLGPDMSMQQRPLGPDMSMQQKLLGPDMSMQQRSVGPDMSMQQRSVGPDMSMQQRPLVPDMSMQQRPLVPDMCMQQRSVGPDMSMQQRSVGPDMSMQQRSVGPDMSMQQRSVGPDILIQQQRSTGRTVPRMGTRLETVPLRLLGHPIFPVPEGSGSGSGNTSAYNTGDSTRSTPLTMELSSHINGGGSLLSINDSAAQQRRPLPAPPTQSDSEKSTQTDTDSQRTRSSSNTGGGSKRVTAATGERVNPIKSSKTKESRKKRDKEPSVVTAPSPVYDVYEPYSQVMYTTPGNLQETIHLQQKIFESQVQYQRPIDQNSRLVGNCDMIVDESAEYCYPPDAFVSQPMEWVVKKRPDGSRYITRRPVRSKILKERAKRLAEERCGQTTDDDAMSEMKMGRYWNRSERRKHVEKAKEHRKRRREALERVREEEGVRERSGGSSVLAVTTV